jgi:hypothetical protein
VVGFEALLSQLPAYSSASFTAPPTVASPVVISGLPSSTGFTCYVVASNAGGILTSSSSPGLMLSTAPFAPNAPSAPKGARRSEASSLQLYAWLQHGT